MTTSALCRAGTAIQNGGLPIVSLADASAPTHSIDNFAQARRISVYARLGPQPVTAEPTTAVTPVERHSVHARLGPLRPTTMPAPAEVRCA